MTPLQGQEAGPFIVRHSMVPEVDGGTGSILYVEAFAWYGPAWEVACGIVNGVECRSMGERVDKANGYDRVRLAGGPATAKVGSHVVGVEATTWAALFRDLRPHSTMPWWMHYTEEALLAAWNEKHASGSQAGGGTDG